MELCGYHRRQGSDGAVNGPLLGLPASDIPMTGAAMIAEVDRVIRDLGLRGISLDPGWSDPPAHADHDDAREVADRCAELDVPLMLTTSALVGADTAFSHPVFIDRLAAACPDTKIIAAHGGWPLVQEMCAVAMARPNVYVSADQGMLSTVGTMDYLAAINTIISDQFLFASSYPTGPGMSVRRLGVADQVEFALEHCAFRGVPAQRDSLVQRRARFIVAANPGEHFAADRGKQV